ncbi:MAG: helix-turn-helix domain-containing protein [Erysipelotrichaceae bacterium]|nr:helix-turn-helix domain-containing protein [Erysipelotrichaceae bacterium]
MTLLNAVEILKEAGISKSTLYRLIDEGLPYTYVGKRKMFDPNDVNQFIKKKRNAIKQNLVQGHNYTNEEITLMFNCKKSGCIRMSNTKRAMILISNYTGIGNSHTNYWKNDILYFSDDNSDASNEMLSLQEKKLALSSSNKTTLYLFDSYEKGIYNYRGIVKLISEPYIVDEYNLILNNNQKVWKYQLKLIDQNDYLSYDFIKHINKTNTLKGSESKEKTKLINREICEMVLTKKYIISNPEIEKYVMNRANGICELCEKPAPFKVNDIPFLQIYYINSSQEDGKDNVSNAAALCPNCYQKMKHLNLKEDKKTIQYNVDNANWIYNEEFSLNKLVKCPYCHKKNRVDLEEYTVESESESEYGMGPDIYHIVRKDSYYTCDYCQKDFLITGYVEEYPLGSVNDDTIESSKISE